MPTSGGGYSGQYDGEKVKTGAHVHCNRFNGTKSDHRYWKKSNPKAWIDFYHSDCDYHAGKYGCADFGNMSKCDGLDKRGKGVKDCSSWSGNPKHKNWPKTCWYRKLKVYVMRKEGERCADFIIRGDSRPAGCWSDHWLSCLWLGQS